MSKFNSVHDEYLYEGSVVSGVSQGDGDVEAPTGWFAEVNLLRAEDTEPEDEEERAALAHYGTPYLILHESNEGFVTVTPFEKREDRDRRIGELQRAYALWSAEISDEQALEAILNYRLTLVSTSTNEDGSEPLDRDGDLSLSAEAQHQTRDDVIDFITQNVENLGHYMRETKRGWGLVGADFALNRNRHGSGFWDFAGGPAVDEIVASCHAWGAVHLYVGESGEIEVQ